MNNESKVYAIKVPFGNFDSFQVLDSKAKFDLKRIVFLNKEDAEKYAISFRNYTLEEVKITENDNVYNGSLT